MCTQKRDVHSKRDDVHRALAENLRQCVGGMLLAQWCHKHVSTCLYLRDVPYHPEVVPEPDSVRPEEAALHHALLQHALDERATQSEVVRAIMREDSLCLLHGIRHGRSSRFWSTLWRPQRTLLPKGGMRCRWGLDRVGPSLSPKR